MSGTPLAAKLKLDETKLNTLFSGSKVVIKRGLSAETAPGCGWPSSARWEPCCTRWPSRRPCRRPPAPLAPPPMGDPQIPPPAPIAVNTPARHRGNHLPGLRRAAAQAHPVPNCACDMPRGIAAKEEEAAAERTRRARSSWPGTASRRAAPRPGPAVRAGGSGQRLLHFTAEFRVSPSRTMTPTTMRPCSGCRSHAAFGRMRNFLGGLLWLNRHAVADHPGRADAPARRCSCCGS
jgi:hypothetical protein